jgi:AraC family transcriptional regulator, melibiose operon regulatory protein
MVSDLEVFSDLSERLNYNLPDFPLYVRKGRLRQFDRYAAACHWHPDLEFILVLDGSMEYFVNGRILHLANGDGIFVNSKRLHYGFSADKTDCSFIVGVVHPSLLGEGSGAGKTYLAEKFGTNTADFILLKDQIPWQREALHTLAVLYDEMHAGTPNPLRLLSLATSLCASIGDHVQQVSNRSGDDPAWLIAWKMAEFIHRHYGQKMTLDDICAAGMVSRSRCCELFGKYIGKTPNTYVTHYRLQKSCEMLRETNRSISEIALACGFQSSSYFAYVFRKEKGTTPQEYRKQTGISATA